MTIDFAVRRQNSERSDGCTCERVEDVAGKASSEVEDLGHDTVLGLNALS